MEVCVSEREERIIHTLQTFQFYFTSVLHVAALYCLIKRTPPQQAMIRKYLLFLQVTVIINGVYMDVLFKPIPLFPAPAGYYTGLLSQAHVPGPAALAGMMLTYLWTALAVFMCCFFRHQALMPDNLKLKKKLIWPLNGTVLVICSVPLITYGTIPIDEAKVKELISLSPYNLCWVPQRGSYFIHERSEEAILLVIFLVMIILFFTVIVLLMFIHMFYVLHKDKKRSAATIIKIRNSIRVLFTQLFTPLVMLVITALNDLCSILCECLPLSFTLISYCLCISHPLAHNIILLLVTPTYRGIVMSVPRKFLETERMTMCNITITSTMFTVSDVVEDAHLSAGVLLNCLLLYAIRRFTRTALGSYKQLLTVFAAYDIFLTVLHAAVKPKVVIVGTTFGVWGAFEDRRVNSLYCACFTVPFALMIIHFVYRFWSIRHPHLILLFSKKSFIAPVACYPLVALVSWYLLAFYFTTGEGAEIGKFILRNETMKRFGMEMNEGWLIMNHWENGQLNRRVFICLAIVDVIMLVSFSIATVLVGFTFYHIRRAEVISLQANTMQRKLLIAVCAQTFVPFVFVYIPYACCINFPFFRLPVFFMDDASMLLTSCFPAWDAVVIIVLMKDYRIF